MKIFDKSWLWIPKAALIRKASSEEQPAVAQPAVEQSAVEQPVIERRVTRSRTRSMTSVIRDV